MATELITLTNTEKQQKGAELADKMGELYKIRADKKQLIRNLLPTLKKLKAKFPT